MKRPEFVTNEDILRWSEIVDSDDSIPIEMANSPIIREVCYAGCFLIEELEKLECPEVLIVRIQYTAGKLSFGRDPWEIHQMILEKYKNNTLEFEEDEASYVN